MLVIAWLLIRRRTGYTGGKAAAAEIAGAALWPFLVLLILAGFPAMLLTLSLFVCILAVRVLHDAATGKIPPRAARRTAASGPNARASS